MRRPVRRRSVVNAGLALFVPMVGGPASACEYFSPNLRVVHPWTRASLPGAERAVVCMRFDEISRPDRLIGVHTPVARGARLAGAGAGPDVDLALEVGHETELTEAGVHIVLEGLLQPLQIARSYPLRLQFAEGGDVNATLNVEYARFA